MIGTGAEPERPGFQVAAVWRNVGFICAAVVLVYCASHAFDPPRLNWGDSGSDYNVMTAGRNFDKYGFIRLQLTPYLLDRSVMTTADSVMIYTHYPQLPDLMNGVLRRVFGMSDIVHFRFVALLFSFAALFFVYRLVSSYWSRLTAQIAIALWVINPLWIQHADYLHQGPYGAFFGFGTLYFLRRALVDSHSRRFLVASAAFLLLTFLSSYDYWIFIPLLLAVMTVAHYRRPFSRPVIRTLGILAAFALVAILVKTATNMWALGGPTAFLHDLQFQFVERATDKVVHTSFAGGIWPTLYGRVERFFSLLLFPVTAFWAVLPMIQQRWLPPSPPGRAPPINPLVLLLAAVPFLAVFTEIWVAQYYPALMILPFYAVGSAALIVWLLDGRQLATRLAGIALLVALGINSLDEDLRFKKAFLDRSAIRTLRIQLDSLARPGQEILVNHVFDHSYRYYFDRQTVPLIVNPPFRFEAALKYFADPNHPRFSTPVGALLVQHKHLTDELFDKGYYYILAHYHLWDAWANPPRYRRFIDSLVADRDSQLVAQAARVGRKLFESDYYVLWRIDPSVPATGH